MKTARERALDRFDAFSSKMIFPTEIVLELLAAYEVVETVRDLAFDELPAIPREAIRDSIARLDARAR